MAPIAPPMDPHLPVWLKLQTQVYSNQKTIKSKSSFQTRWTAQIAACHAVKSRLDLLLALLGQLGEDINGDRSSHWSSVNLANGRSQVYFLHGNIPRLSSRTEIGIYKVHSWILILPVNIAVVWFQIAFFVNNEAKLNAWKTLRRRWTSWCTRATCGLSCNILKRLSRFSRRFEVHNYVNFKSARKTRKTLQNIAWQTTRDTCISRCSSTS